MMKRFLILLFLSLSLQGMSQDFVLEVGGGVHFANIVRQSLSPNLHFQNNEHYHTKPSRAFLVRLIYGKDKFPVRFFLLGHLTSEYSVDKKVFFESTIKNKNYQSIDERISQKSLYLGPSISWPYNGPMVFQLHLGAGFSSINMPDITFGCDDCSEAQLLRYTPHGGLGFGGIAELAIGYKVVEGFQFNITYSYHGGQIYNTSVETWLTGESWGSSIKIPAPNIIRWNNSLLSWSLVYSFGNYERSVKNEFEN